MPAHNVQHHIGRTGAMLDPGDAGSIDLKGRSLAVVGLISTGAEARTLPAPVRDGIVVTIGMRTDGGDITLTVTGGYDQAGSTTIVFNDAGDFVMLVSVETAADTYEWRVVGYDGVTGPVQQVASLDLNGTADGLILDADADTTISAPTDDQIDFEIGGSDVGVLSALGLALTVPLIGAQGAPTAETGAATVTAADILTGIVTLTHATGSDVALTVDTGTAMDTALAARVAVGQSIDWTVINLSAAAADTGTVTAAAGHTLVGVMVVQSAHSTTGGIHGNAARFRSRRTATNTWITYRIG